MTRDDERHDIADRSVAHGDPLQSNDSSDPTPIGEVGLFAEASAVDATLDSTGGRSRKQRGMAIAAVCAVVVAVVGAAVVVGRDSTPPVQPDIALDVWVPYWTLEASNEAAALRIPSMRDVSPFWFNATGATEISIDPNANTAATDRFLESARSSGASIVPSIVDAMPAGQMAAVLADPATRATHIDTLVAFANAGDYAGIDLDYEQFAFADGRDTWATTRPNWVEFIELLANELHADGRTLTVSIPPVYDGARNDDSGFWVYDYGAISNHVDAIRIMAYDFSVAEPGPIAPLEFVERAIAGALDATNAPDKLVLGVPAYGRNWPTGSSPECEGVELEGVTSVNTRTVDDLIARRGGTPTFDEVTGESSFTYDLVVEGTDCVQARQVHFVDADGIRLRMDLARENRFAGVSLWAFGFDDDDVWNAILPTVVQG